MAPNGQRVLRVGSKDTSGGAILGGFDRGRLASALQRWRELVAEREAA